MTVPTASSFPTELDTDTNLYEVHDSLRVRLAEDYTPGDTSITVFGDDQTMLRFPATGYITLTEQCSDPDVRAISLYYGSHTTTTFDQLELLPGFVDAPKFKKITNVTQNVMDVHHNALKDAIIAIEEFIGVQGRSAVKPLTGTMEERINFLRKLVLTPKAWFSVNKNIGIVPLTVEFTDLSFRLGTDGTTGTISYIWDFGDNTDISDVSLISVSGSDVVTANNVLVRDMDGGTILKTYTRPGIYDGTLTVINDFGQDTVVLPGIVNARVAAPDLAVIDYVSRPGQILTAGTPTGGPYTDTVPRIRSPINTLIDIEIQDGVNGYTGRSYGGELLDGDDNPIDPIVSYTWNLADDLIHNNSKTTKASFSVGGIYDATLRVDTEFGAYRITKMVHSLDIVEKTNLWLWNYTSDTTVQAHEFGLISETFKTSVAECTISKDDSFLDAAPNSTQQKREFNRNNGFAQRGTTPSGNSGTGLLYWASGRAAMDSPTTETILFSEYNGFVASYTTRSPISRPWNWASFVSDTSVYFVFGATDTAPAPYTSPTNQDKVTYDLAGLAISNTTTLGNANYKNGADELQQNKATYDGSGDPVWGHFSVYRTAWQSNVGYIVRNSGVGNFFRLNSFYRTDGITSVPFQNIKKLPDMAGPTKVEGQLIALTGGIYFFNNTGSVSAYNTNSGVWETGGPGINSASFRLLQDSTVLGFDDDSQTLLATSDGDHRAYLSFDYSTNAFVKFNEVDTTFSSISARPEGNQWQMRVF